MSEGEARVEQQAMEIVMNTARQKIGVTIEQIVALVRAEVERARREAHAEGFYDGVDRAITEAVTMGGHTTPDYRARLEQLKEHEHYQQYLAWALRERARRATETTGG